MRCLSELRKIIRPAKKSSEQSDEDLVGVSQVYDLAVGAITILGFIVKEPDDKAREKIQNGKRAFMDLAYWTKMKYNRLSNEKILRALPLMLRKKYSLSPGAIIKTITWTDFIDKETLKKQGIEPGVLLLYLGVDSDENYDTIVLKVLSENKILLYHKRESLTWFVENFAKHFVVVQKANIDQGI